VVAFVLPTSAARSSRRSAIAVTVREEETMKSVSAPSSAVAWSTSWRALDSSGLKYFVASCDCCPLPCSEVAKPLMTPCRSRRVAGFSVLNSWSRSTGVVVWLSGSVAPSPSFGLLLGPGVSDT
jgi:hypothetical protein